jgi:hypothetical protein
VTPTMPPPSTMIRMRVPPPVAAEQTASAGSAQARRGRLTGGATARTLGRADRGNP